MKNRIKKFIVFSFFIFSILVSSTSVFATEKVININLKGENQEGIDFSHRKLVIWKISKNSENVDREELTSRLKSLSNRELSEMYLDPIYSKESDSEGRLSISLDSGTYYAREVESSHKVKTYPFVFVVNQENMSIFSKSGEDKPISETKLIKLSNDNLRLAGAEFDLYRIINGKLERVPLNNNFYSEKGSKELILLTDSNGEINIFNLPIGRYMFKEIKAPDGYSIRERETYFDIVGDYTEVKIINFKGGYGGFKFKKVSEDGMPLSKAKFMVTKKSNGFFEKIEENGKTYIVESDNMGNFTVENLPYGDYYLWEIEAPNGYEPIPGKVKFIVDENSFNKEISIVNKRIPEIPPKTPPETPPKTPIQNPPKLPTPIIIPKTGDITLILMLLVGLVFIMAGYRLVKEDSVK